MVTQEQIQNLTKCERFVFEFEIRMNLIYVQLFLKAARKREQLRKEQEEQ